MDALGSGKKMLFYDRVLQLPEKMYEKLPVRNMKCLKKKLPYTITREICYLKTS